MAYDEDCAQRLAWWRLRYPTELGESAEKEYWAYLRRRAVPVARWLLGQGDTAGLQFLLSHTDWEKETLTELCALAREQDTPEALALLLEEQHKRFPSGMDKTFDL